MELQGQILNIYLEHDTDDLGFINLIADNLEFLGIFHVFVSPFVELENPDHEMEIELRKSHVLVLVISRKSLRSMLIQREMEIAEKENKLMIPFFFGKIPRISRLLPLIGKYQEHRPIDKKTRYIIEPILNALSLYHNRFGFSVDLIEKARDKLKNYTPKVGELTRRASFFRRQIAFRELIQEVLEKLGYTVVGKRDLERNRQFFDMSATTERHKIWVKCVLGFLGTRDISKIKSALSLSGANKVWVVCLGIHPRAGLSAEKNGILPIHPRLLIDKVDPLLRERFANRLKSIIAGKIEVDDEKGTLMRLIQSPEGQNLEFKSTLRYDLSKKMTNSTLEKACLKTLCAFMNASGGFLIIGVSNDRKIGGLSDDYKTLKIQNSDGFENHLTNIIGSRMGNQFLRFVRISFVSIEEKEICRINVSPSDAPVFLKEDSIEEFFVRTGNNSRPFSMAEAVEYIRKHWK
jgi:hypothetical protein